MKRIVLIGPGNIEFHYHELLGLKKDKFESEIEKIAKTLSDSDVEIALLPDKGISLEIAKKFKKYGGRVIGLAPLSDKFPGIGHLKQYINEKVNGNPLFDEFVDTGDWPKQDLNMGLYGDSILYLGKSPGTEGERNYAIYMYKIISGMKTGVKQGIESIHKQARAGKNSPFTIFIYSQFLKSKKLSIEDEEYAKKFGVKLIYVKNSSELEIKLKN